MKRTTFRVETVSVKGPALAAGLLLAAGMAGCGGDSDASGEPQPTSATRSPTVLAMPAGDTRDGAHAPIEAGTYLIPSSPWSIAGFTVTFPEGWTLQHGHVYGEHADTPEEFGFYAVVVEEIFSDPCQEGSEPTQVGPRSEDLVTALLEQSGPAKSGPVDTTLGGYPATRIDLTVPKHWTDCTLLDEGFGLQLWYSEPADKHFVLLPDSAASVYVIDVDGKSQVFLTQVGNPTSAADRAELQRVLDSIRIEG